jgi:hypothetical protein
MIPEMSVLENVALGGYLRSRSGTVRAMLRLDRAEERQLFAEAERQLARVGMAQQMHETAGNLALGPQRLMEIARALCTDPALLLLDEPAAGLRLKEKQALGEVLRQLKGEGMSTNEFVHARIAATGGEADAFGVECAVKREILGHWDAFCSPYVNGGGVAVKRVVDDLYSGALSASLTGEPYPVMLAKQFRRMAERRALNGILK